MQYILSVKEDLSNEVRMAAIQLVIGRQLAIVVGVLLLG